MQNSDKKAPVVLFIAEGANISSSWRGNALLASNPPAFFDLWKRYPHTLLQSTTAPYDDESDFLTIATGHKAKSNQEYLNELIKSKEIENVPSLNEYLGNTFKNKAALHLIGKLDIKQRDDIKQKLFSLLKIAKERRIYRAYLHLILGDNTLSDPRDCLSLMNDIDQYSQKIGIGEIASITGVNNIKNCTSATNLKETLQSVINGTGLHALSFEQALLLHANKCKSLSEKRSVSIVHHDSAIGKFNTFDSVIFFDNDTKYLSDFILTISQNTRFKLENLIPECISIATLFQSIDQDFNNIAYLFNKHDESNFCDKITKYGIRTCIITDSTRIQHVKLYLLNNMQYDQITIDPVPTKDINDAYFENYVETTDHMFKKLVQRLEENQYDLFIIDIPSLYHSYNHASFAHSSRMVKLIDNFLKKVCPVVFRLNGALLITSINNSNSIGAQNGRYFQPFIFAMKDLTKQKINNAPPQNQIMTALLRKKQSIQDICPTIYDIFNLEIEKNNIGNTLLDKNTLY